MCERESVCAYARARARVREREYIIYKRERESVCVCLRIHVCPEGRRPQAGTDEVLTNR